MKYYFVSYSHQKGFGSIIFNADKPFSVKIAKELAERKGTITNVVILYWKELTKQEWEANL